MKMIAQMTLEMLFVWCLIYGVPLALLMALLNCLGRQEKEG